MTEPVDQAETLAGHQRSAAADTAPRLLGGRYLLEERIASGGMASVWRAHDELLARTVAVKLLHDHLASDEAFRERFRREAIAAAKLSHPHIVSLYDTGSDDGRTYLVMEYVAGVTLRDVIVDLGTLEPGQAAAIGEKVARALDYAHDRGLVHRDVKPANILIGDDGTVKVTDFGIAKAADEDKRDLTSTGTVLGTAAYVAPEQIVGGPLDGRADQYALACVLYEGLTGRRPFAGESAVATAALRLETEALPMRSLRAAVPRALDGVVARGLARRPEDRFPSAGAFADALAPFVDADTGQTAALAARTEATVALPRTAGGARAPDGRRDGTRVAAGSSRPRDARSTSAFVRSEGRWLAPVLGLLLLAAVLVGVGLATGMLAADSFPRVFARDEPQDETPAPAAAALVAPVDLRSFDPQGNDGRENDDRLPALIDGDEDTSWRADLYNTADFGNLKDGVGVVIDLGRRHRLEQIALRTTTPGIRYEIRVADAPADELRGWRVVGSVAEATGLDAVRFEQAPTTRYVLVWVTGNLQPQNGRFTAGFAELAVRGGPA
jgi:serine/threonine protein kinase